MYINLFMAQIKETLKYYAHLTIFAFYKLEFFIFIEATLEHFLFLPSNMNVCTRPQVSNILFNQNPLKDCRPNN